MTASEIIALFPNCSDLCIRSLHAAGKPLTLLYFDNLCDRIFLHRYILLPLITASDPTLPPEDLLTCGELCFHTELSTVQKSLLAGEAMVLSEDRAISIKAQSELGRAVSEPETETVIRGPREGFTERVGNNAALLRRRIRSPHLKYETLSLGKQTATLTAIMYLDHLVNRQALNKLKQRLNEIDSDAILDSGQLELWLEGRLFPFFPSVGNSERPDKVAAKLLEGRIAILVDGTPVVLTVPYLFAESLQSTEDYGKNPLYALFVRSLRLCSLLLSVLLPGFFLALLLYQPSAIPAQLAQKIAAARENIPFSPFCELLLVLFAFEMIREVAIRMPRTVGSAVSLVAALILGDSAISAGIASAPVIIVVAFTAIAGFLVPPYMNTVILLRIGFMIAARLGGLFGIAMLGGGILIALCAKDSFGTPYLSPLSPASLTGLLDFLFVAPPWGMKKYPPSLIGQNRTRNRRKKGNSSCEKTI